MMTDIQAREQENEMDERTALMNSLSQREDTAPDRADDFTQPVSASLLTTSDKLDKYAEAMAKVQGEIQNPPRNRTVTVSGKNKQTGKAYSYEFKYTTFDVVLEEVRPLLSKNDICIIQVPTKTKEGMMLVTRLLHKSGQWVESVYPLVPEETGLKAQGAAISYTKRYALSSMLALASDDDDDANVAEGDQVTKKDGEDMWGGPMNKTQIKAAVREFAAEVEACSDLAQLVAFLNQPESIALTDQMMRDIPSWYYGQEGSDIPGLHARIETRRDELVTEQEEAHGAPA